MSVGEIRGMEGDKRDRGVYTRLNYGRQRSDTNRTSGVKNC